MDVWVLNYAIMSGLASALSAAGFHLIFERARFVNLAHGSTVFLGGWLTVILTEHFAGWEAGAFDWALAAVAVAVGLGAAAWIFDRVVLHRARGKANVLVTLATLAVVAIVSRAAGAAIPDEAGGWVQATFDMGSQEGAVRTMFLFLLAGLTVAAWWIARQRVSIEDNTPATRATDTALGTVFAALAGAAIAGNGGIVTEVWFDELAIAVIAVLFAGRFGITAVMGTGAVVALSAVFVSGHFDWESYRNVLSPFAIGAVVLACLWKREATQSQTMLPEPPGRRALALLGLAGAIGLAAVLMFEPSTFFAGDATGMIGYMVGETVRISILALAAACLLAVLRAEGSVPFLLVAIHVLAVFGAARLQISLGAAPLLAALMVLGAGAGLMMGWISARLGSGATTLAGLALLLAAWPLTGVIDDTSFAEFSDSTLKVLQVVAILAATLGIAILWYVPRFAGRVTPQTALWTVAGGLAALAGGLDGLLTAWSIPDLAWGFGLLSLMVEGGVQSWLGPVVGSVFHASNQWALAGRPELEWVAIFGSGALAVLFTAFFPFGLSGRIERAIGFAGLERASSTTEAFGDTVGAEVELDEPDLDI